MRKKEDITTDTNSDEAPINIGKEIISWILTVAAAVAVALLLNNFVLINARIPSGSMENTIQEGDRLIGNRLAYIKSNPQRGDIVIFKFPDDETQNYVKRVIGLPGETVRVEDGKIYINDAKEPLKEDYLKEKWTIETGPYVFQVPNDSYLVMGDNRNNSYDARYWTNTYVSKQKILGKAACRYFPFNKMGLLH
jgi:signal peptidase I